MRTFAYRVCAHYDNYDIEIATNDIYQTIETFHSNNTAGIYTEIVSGITGEVLTYVNSPEEEDYMSDEFALMYKCWLIVALRKSLE